MEPPDAIDDCIHEIIVRALAAQTLVNKLEAAQVRRSRQDGRAPPGKTFIEQLRAQLVDVRRAASEADDEKIAYEARIGLKPPNRI